MKHEILEKLKRYEDEYGINIPKFIVLKSKEDYTPISSFLMSNDKKYAVRSSFVSEDGDRHSFAGQFETILNVEKCDIKKAVEKVFDSMQNTNVNEYCGANNILKFNGGCVIVQEMIDADYSGVVFTSNPQGILNETVVVVGNGIGNNVVEDKEDTTHYFYNQDDGIFYFEQNGNTPILEESVFRELIETSIKIKYILGYNADIEFAIKDNIIYILQARPITTLKFDSPVIFDSSNIIESYPGVSLPLTQSFVQTIYYEIFKNCLLRITKDKEYINSIDKQLQKMVDVANWRIYYRISNWYDVLRLLPCSKKLIPVWQKMMGVENKEIVFNANKPSLKTKKQVLKSFMYYIRKCPEYNEKLDKNFKILYSDAIEKLDKCETIEELLNLYDNTRKDVLKEWDVTLINDIYTFIYTHLAGDKHKGDICDIKNIESMKPAKAINELVRIARDSGIELDIYDNAFDTYIKEYGDRVLGELKLETQTYRTNPELLDQYVHNSLCNETSAKEIVDIENKDDIKNPFVKRAKIGIKNREISRMNRSRLFGFTRELFLKIGEILVQENKIEHKRDVFYLYIDEIRKTNDDYKELVVYRKKQEQHYNKVPHYARLVFEKNVVNKERNIEEEILSSNNKELFGIPTSTGIVSGEVVVIDDTMSDVDTAGKIIVTKSTDPGWVFMIKNSIGIIAERGSLLSHTAIISRELHKPAVVNVKDCTRILKTGDIVTLDAISGKIEKVNRS